MARVDISRVVIGLPQAEMRPSLHTDMSERGGHGQGAMTADNGAIHIDRHPESGAHIGVDPARAAVDRPTSGRSDIFALQPGYVVGLVVHFQLVDNVGHAPY